MAGFSPSNQHSAYFPSLSSTTFAPRRYRAGNLRTWSGHLPFARDLIASLKPRILVELGTHYGESYFGFCQSVEEAGISCQCYAVDTWRGDSHAGQYGNEVWEEVERYNSRWYGAFSQLLRRSFDNAQPEFSDESIDLLHIDGLHTYDAVKHDWDAWFPKVAPGGLVLLHDIAARHLDFGVWKLWDELSAKYESFAFHHYYGLGVIRKPGQREAAAGVLDYLFAAENADAIRRYYVLCSNHLDSKADVEGVADPSNCQAFQLFYLKNGGFSEQASMLAMVEPGPWRKLTFALADGLEGRLLRLDLGTRPAIVNVRSVALSRAFDQQELWQCTPTGEGQSHFRVDGTARLLRAGSCLEVFSYGNDSQLLVSLPDFMPLNEPVTFEAWVRLEPDLSRLAVDGSNVVALDSDDIPEVNPPAPAGMSSARRNVFVDLGGEVKQTLSELVRAGKKAGFLPLPLDNPTLPRNDWTPAKGESSFCRAMTADPWITCPADFNSTEVRFFAIQMSCSCDGQSPHAQLFWSARGGSGFKEPLSIRFPVLGDGKFHLYVIDLHSTGVISNDGASWRKCGLVESVRLDPLDKPGVFAISFAGFASQGKLVDQLIRRTLGLPELKR